MKKILAVLLTLLLVVTGCGKDSDINTTELINTALNTTAKAEGNAFDLKLVYDITGADMDMKLDMDGLFRQNGAFDVETFKKGDFSGLEFELVGNLEMTGMGTTMNMAAYIKDGIIYADVLGSKIKINLADVADEMIDSFEEIEGDVEENKVTLTEDDLKDVIITKEDGYYNYKLTKDALKKLISNAPEGTMDGSDLEMLDMIDTLEAFMNINNDGSVRSVGLNAKMSVDGADMNIVFTLTMVDIKKADSIEFPDFNDFVDTSALGL